MVDPDRERAFMALWLADKLAPGEGVTAGMHAWSGPSLRWDWLPLSAMPTEGILVGWLYNGPISHQADGVIMLITACTAAASGLLMRARKLVYLAVTERQLIAVQLRRREQPVRVLFSLPISAVHLATTDGMLVRGILVTATDCSMITIGGKNRARVRLSTRGRRRQFDDLLTAVGAQGGAVDLPRLPAIAPPNTSA